MFSACTIVAAELENNYVSNSMCKDMLDNDTVDDSITRQKKRSIMILSVSPPTSEEQLNARRVHDNSRLSFDTAKDRDAKPNERDCRKKYRVA